MRWIATIAIAGSFVIASGTSRYEAAPVAGDLVAPPPEVDDVVERYCVRCHNERRLAGNLTLESFDLERAGESAEVGERVIKKLRAGMMPPAGARRPGGDTLQILVERLESVIDHECGGSSHGRQPRLSEAQPGRVRGFGRCAPRPSDRRSQLPA